MNVIPKVSVVTVTYGQEDFIIETIKGVLGQRFEGSIEYIIVNDNSLDNTDEIIKNYLSRTAIPLNINVRYIRHEKNKGAIPNFFWGIQQARGKYVALCEGDDYWTDPHKLQKQVDFLENNPDYVLCFHDIKILKSDGEMADDFITTLPEQYEERLTLAKKLNYIHTPSVVFRNILKDELNTIEFYKSPIGDYFLYMTLTKYGKMGHIPETMAVYRYGVGVFSSLSALKSTKANLLLFTNLYSFEKDAEIKEIFFEHIQSCIAQIDNEFGKLQFENSKFNEILSSKRYRFLKTTLSYFGITI
ncbi:Glycosyl transferase family 2 [Chryseobacterium piscicola]|uniref:Glycosyl transferase family 2 n=1 Tax=Chryseobacterium piscicola TaxID=551459 RepID=A0A1N7KEW6_9FLAO|nr:glycosyltransferase [Chryseobacterium piscicola]PQA96342.1 hypothetical protein B0A70_04285 [Chryseobacterium piscicola]SIS60014.1 Glycosyl transferase family 2 [Chryseobacterium piscicola]